MILLLHGCAVQHPVSMPTRPAPVSVPAGESRPATIPTPAPAPVPAPDVPAIPSSRVPVPAPEQGKAAGTLLASARQNVRAGQFSQAEMKLERALRLEPRNARLWHEMAQVKYGQKNYDQAIQFSIKSNSLAGKDSGLIEQNWLLMEKAYLELGESDKANKARTHLR